MKSGFSSGKDRCFLAKHCGKQPSGISRTTLAIAARVHLRVTLTLFSINTVEQNCPKDHHAEFQNATVPPLLVNGGGSVRFVWAL